METNNLNKDIILNQYSEKDIFIRLANIHNMKLARNGDLPTKNISSPFTKDEKPSFNFYKENGIQKFKCNSSGKQGDVWQFVADLHEIDCKHDFKKVLDIIASEMNIGLENDKNKTKTLGKSSVTHTKARLQSPNENNASAGKTLTISKRDFTELDLQYWTKLGVEESFLKKFNLHSISNYCWSEKKPIYTKKESVAFAIELDGQIKLYIPNQPNAGIKKNVLPAFKIGIYGLEQLRHEKKASIIICAGEKDTIVANSRGFNAVTFGSESGHPKPEQIKLLQEHCNTLFVCYDNDEAGEKGRNALVKRFPSIIPLQLPKNENVKGYDITDYFQDNTAQDFQLTIDLAQKNKSIVEPTKENQITTIIHVTEDYLNENYEIRHNIIANEIEISKKNLKDWTELNENSLWIEMQKKSIKVPASTLEKILKSDFVPKFNPLTDYFENLPAWDGKTDFITQYADYIKLAPEEDKEQYNYHFKKWCVRAVKCATIDNYFNKNAFVISDEGKGQNIGKTTWIRFLCPPILSNYLKDDLPKDEKDAKIALTQNFLVNLDELASLSRQEINTLKSLFSADKIKVRFPYDKKEIVVKRVASFIGSTNLTNFLHDETGSVRWLCFVADKIDFSYKTNFDIGNLWAQAYSLSKDKNFEETITSIDMNENEMRNAKFQMQSPEKDLICRFLEIPTTIEETKILTSTEIQNYLAGFATSIKLNNVTIGKALTSLKYRKIRSSTTTKYAVKYKENVD